MDISPNPKRRVLREQPLSVIVCMVEAVGDDNLIGRMWETLGYCESRGISHRETKERVIDEIIDGH